MPEPENVREDTNYYDLILPGLVFNKNGEPMFVAGEMRWPDCPYAAGVAMQYHQWRVLELFLDAGIAMAVEKGQADILRSRGVPVPLAEPRSQSSGVEGEDGIHFVKCGAK